MRDYPFSLQNYIENTLNILWLFTFKRQLVSKFKNKQIEFQYQSKVKHKPIPKNIENWRAPWYQNATINFSTNDMHLSSDQLKYESNSFLSKNNESIHKRLAAMANDLRRYGAKKAYCIHTIDAAYSRVDHPVFSYNRLKHAKNRFLWPLDKYHTIGDRKFLSLHNKDKILFRKKSPNYFGGVN